MVRGSSADVHPALRAGHGDGDGGGHLQDESAEHGPGWVWGSGVGRVTVRFETAESGPGPVRTFSATDPALTPSGT